MSEGNAAESSLLLWLLAAVSLALAAHVAWGWLRTAAARERWAERLRPLLLASVVLGCGFNGAILLSLGAQPLPFEIGFAPWVAALLWLGGTLAAAPPLVLLAHSRSRPALAASALWLAALLTALVVGWLLAAGLRPGPVWRLGWIGGACGALAIGIALALLFALGESFRASPRKRLWHLGGALLFAAVVFGGQELLFLGVLLHEQGASSWRHGLPLSITSLACGAMLPLVYSLLALDLHLRRSERRQRRQTGPAGFAPAKRRKRRHRMRPL